MARIGVGNKYNLAVNGVGYLVRGLNYKKKDLRVFLPTFASSGNGEDIVGDLDVWKKWEQSDLFEGNTYLKAYNPNAAYSIDYLTYDKANKALTPEFADFWVQDQTTLVASKTPIFCAYKGAQYVAYGTKLYTIIDHWSEGLTAVKTDFAADITDMCVYNGYLWVATGSGANILWGFSGTVWTSIATGGFEKMAAFGANLVGTAGGYLYTLTGTPTSHTRATIGTVGDSFLPIGKVIEFNHRIFVLKNDGLFAYDGVQVSQVLTTAYNDGCVFNGQMYLTATTSFVRFNGSTIEDLTSYVNATGFISGICATSKYLHIAGYDGDLRSVVLRYDGLFWNTRYAAPTGVYILGYHPWLIIVNNTNTSKYQVLSNNVDGHTYNTLGHQIITSVFTGGVLDIWKYLNGVTVSANLPVGLTITTEIDVSFRTFDGSTWTAWQTLGKITPTVKTLEVNSTAYSGAFKQLQLKFSMPKCWADQGDGSGHSVVPGIMFYGFSAEYTLVPDYKREWQFSLLCVGSTDNPLELLDGTTESKTASSLRENLYASRAAISPVGFEDIDYTILNGAHNNSVTTINVDTADLFPSAGFVKIDDEIIRYSGKTATTLTGCTRASLGTSAASHSDNALVNLYYRVILSDIVNEEVYWPVDAVSESVPTLNNPETILTVVAKEA